MRYPVSSVRLLDEHVAHSYAVQLRKREPALTVRVIGEPGAPATGTLDPGVLMWCEANGYILVTNNRNTMPRHLAEHLTTGHHVPGILILNPDEGIGRTIDELLLIAGAGFAAEYMDRITFLPVAE